MEWEYRMRIENGDQNREAENSAEENGREWCMENKRWEIRIWNIPFGNGMPVLAPRSILVEGGVATTGALCGCVTWLTMLN